VPDGNNVALSNAYKVDIDRLIVTVKKKNSFRFFIAVIVKLNCEKTTQIHQGQHDLFTFVCRSFFSYLEWKSINSHRIAIVWSMCANTTHL